MVFNIQLTIAQSAPPTLLVHVGAPARAYISWVDGGNNASNSLHFGGPGLTINNGFAVNSPSPFEPFIVDVPANDYLYVINPEAGIGADKLLTMMVVY